MGFTSAIPWLSRPTQPTLSPTTSLLASYGERALVRLQLDAWTGAAVDFAAPALASFASLAAAYLPAGAAFPATRTAAGMTRDEWYRTRHAEAVRYLTARGLDLPRAWWAAVALLGHWAHETGHGRHETDYALGNIRAGSGWRGDVHYLQGDDDSAPAPYRAYASLREGVADNASLAIDGSRYAPSFRALLASWGRGPFVVTYGNRSIAFPMDVVQWYADLTRAGWHPYSEESQAIYRGTVTMAARSLLAADPRAGAAPASARPGLGSAVGAAVLGVAAAAGGVVLWRYAQRAG